MALNECLLVGAGWGKFITITRNRAKKKKSRDKVWDQDVGNLVSLMGAHLYYQKGELGNPMAEAQVHIESTQSGKGPHIWFGWEGAAQALKPLTTL